MGEVAELWRYPVKSMGGERVVSAGLGADGLRGDRCWAVRDERRGAITEARKMPALLSLASRYPDGDGKPAEIVLPGGGTVRTDDPGVHGTLSAALGHEVTLWPRLPESEREHYRRALPDGDAGRHLLELFAVESDDLLPDLSSMPAELFTHQTMPGTYFDWAPVHLITDRSLEALRRLAPESDVDVRRFRPNIVLRDGTDGTDGFPEQGWTGRRLRIGGAVLRITDRTPRCAMITHPQPGLAKDRALARLVHTRLDHCLGVYATVERPGEVSVGSEAILL
ncbi:MULTISPECIES: MOSC domain-containing protein [Actinomadura]|uniref:MOSC domain-containing protein n=1 Tax=Actinomadura yumaensis TaxID=111807 RepID=A0ABW2CBH2_9ACTN|nr:MOSC N-terminal beta barrel domain-containing protein [Actinomadura sp. J1-007]